ncbi:hypothetical protein GOP47_0003352 [Adiantum capillus-veneris]|uniref:Uncharacterized protein n=1 Tax=Adiantum capillus-veneris TaxID=13818 RepID=A0A9D4VC30_ADICA|nr:hypothetical protein GOP47_0003352 [Adiantum capillus-veneris]
MAGYLRWGWYLRCKGLGLAPSGSHWLAFAHRRTQQLRQPIIFGTLVEAAPPRHAWAETTVGYHCWLQLCFGWGCGVCGRGPYLRWQSLGNDAGQKGLAPLKPSFARSLWFYLVSDIDWLL